MSRVRQPVVQSYVEGDRKARYWALRLACGAVTKRAVRLKPDGSGLKDPPARLPCRCDRCRVARD